MIRTTETITIEKLGSSDLDTNEVLQLQGTYRLADVCRFLFIKPEQFRNQAKKCTESRRVMGIFYHQPEKTYLVEMPVFSQWLADLWLGTDS